MTPAQDHYAAAEKLLDAAMDCPPGENPDRLVARAMVHATLATVVQPAVIVTAPTATEAYQTAKAMITGSER